MFDTRMSVVTLSRGATWAPAPEQAPYLVADPLSPWPADATATCIFRDTSGGELLTVTGTVDPRTIGFTADPDQAEAIPAGANFEILLTTAAGVIYKLRYGKVIRREATFANPPVTQLENRAMLFTDTFPVEGLRSNWKQVWGRTTVHNNTLFSLPNSMGPGLAWGFASSAVRWDTPLAGDSANIHVTLIDPQPIGLKTDCAIILCADQRFTTYLAAVFESSTGADNKLRLVTGNGSTWVDRATPVSHDVVNGDDYTVVYDDLTGQCFIYQGTDRTPLISWTDTMGVVPHGPGYRYCGIGFNAALTPLSMGVQVSGWQAKDGI